MNRNQIFKTTGIFLIVLFLSVFLGCAAKVPTAKISGVEVNDVTSKMVRLRFVVKINNPNPVDITVNKIAYSFLCFDKPVAKDTLDQVVQIPKKAESYFRFPITVKYSDLIEAGITALGRDKIEYTLAAKITIDTPVGEQTLPIRKNGTIKIRNLTNLFGKEEGMGSGYEIPFFEAGTLEISLDRI